MEEDAIGVIDISKEDMEAGNARIRNGKLPYCDYSDSAATIVQYIGEDGRISHDHPSLLFLKKVSKEELPEEIRDYVCMVSDMVRGIFLWTFFCWNTKRRSGRHRKPAGRMEEFQNEKQRTGDPSCCGRRR